MPYQTIRDFFAQSQISQKPVQPAKQAQNQINGPTDPRILDKTEQLNPKAAQQKQSSIDQLSQPEEPWSQHEINVDRPTNMHAPEEAQNQFNILKQAAGGPQNGFITRTTNSHRAVARLARSGHVEHVSEKKLGNGHTLHSWRLTQKGVAALGPTTGMGGRNRR